MTQIHIIDGQDDAILDFITEEFIIEDSHKKSLVDMMETYDFITFADKRFSEFLEKRNRIIIEDEDGTLVEFVIFETDKYKDTEGHKIHVYAHASYLELKKASIIHPSSHKGTVSQHGGRALIDSGWSVGIVEGNGDRTVTYDKHISPFEAIRSIAKEFSLEVFFNVSHNGNKITERKVDFLTRIGVWQGREVEFGTDLGEVRRIERQDVVTALYGLGPEDSEGNRIEVLVEDADALERWGRPDETTGKLRHLIEVYEIDSVREEMTIEEARRYTRTALNKRINSHVEFEASIIDLEKVPGLEDKKIRFGDTIKIKDTSFNPPLYLEARVFEQVRSIKLQGHKEIKLGDFIEYTEEEVTSVWKQLQEEIRRKIGLHELLERTYDKETIDWKDSIVLGDGKDFSTNVSEQAETNAKAHADSVSAEVERVSKEFATDEAKRAENRALEKAVAKAIFESTVNDIMGDLVGKADKSVVEELETTISGKVDAEFVNGQLQGKVDQIAYDQKVAELISDIGDKAGLEYIDGKLVSKADKADVYVIEDIDGMFNNVVKTTQYETDKDGLVQNITSNSTRIEQNESDISSKVEQTTFTQLENNVGEFGTQLATAKTQITQNATAITSKATQSSVNSLTGRVGTAESTITQHVGLIGSKVDNTTYLQDKNGIITQLESNTSKITQTEKDIKSKVESTSFQALEGTVGKIGTRMNTAETSITQNATAITSKASQSSVNSLTGRISTTESTVTQQAGLIRNKVEQSSFDSATKTLGNRITTAEQTVDGFSQTVSDVRADLDGLEIGGRNFVQNGFPSDDSLWSFTQLNSSGSSSISNGELSIASDGAGWKQWQTTSTKGAYALDELMGDDIYTLSFEAKKISSTASGAFQVTLRHNILPSGSVNELVLTTDANELTDKWVKYSVTNNIPQSTLDVMIYSRVIAYFAGIGTVAFRKIKLEKGNKATDWTPAPEDIDSAIHGLGQNLSKNTTAIEQNKTQIGLRATSASVSTLTGRVNTAEGSITANAKEIGLRATTSSVNALTGRLSTAEASITTNANAITSRVTKSEMGAAIDDIDIGGRNLLLNSNLDDGLTKWRNWGTVATGAERSIVLTQELGGINNAFKFVKISPTGQWGYAQDGIKVLPNTTYTISSLFKSSNGTGIIIQKGNGNTDPYGKGFAKTEDSDGSWRKLAYTWTTSNNVESTNFYAGFEGSSTGEVLMAGFKLEKGNKATDWTPAPEDVDSEFVKDRSRIASAESTIKQHAGEITSKVSKTDYNGNSLVSMINQTASTVKIQAKNITLKGAVTVLSDITGSLGNITAGNISGTNITGGTITGSTFKSSDSLYNLTLNGVGLTFTSTADKSKMVYQSGGIWGYHANGNRSFVVSSEGLSLYTTTAGNYSTRYLSDGQYSYKAGNKLSYHYGDNGMYLYNTVGARTGFISSNGNDVNISSVADITMFGKDIIQLSAPKINMYGNAFVDGNVSANNLNLGHNGDVTTDSGRLVLRAGGGSDDMILLQANEVRVVKPLTVSTYVPIKASELIIPVAGEQVITKTSGNMRLDNTSGYSVLGSQSDYIYLQTGGTEVRVTNWKSGSVYKPIRASSHPTSSSIFSKSNIRSLNLQDAERVLDNVDIARYHINTNLEQRIYDKEKIGVISEMVPKEIRDEDGVDTYSMISVLWKVVQSHREEIRVLKESLSDLMYIVD